MARSSVPGPGGEVSGDQLGGHIVTISPPPPQPDQNNIYLKVVHLIGLDIDMDGSLLSSPDEETTMMSGFKVWSGLLLRSTVLCV